MNPALPLYYPQVVLFMCTYPNLSQLCCVQKLISTFFCDNNVSDMAKPFSVVVFHCRHMFHKECLPSSGAVSHSLFVQQIIV